MLTRESVAAMTGDQLKELEADLLRQSRANLQAEIAAGRTKSTWRRGAAKLRVRSGGKPDRAKQERLREEFRRICSDHDLVRDEMKRRAHAQAPA